MHPTVYHLIALSHRMPLVPHRLNYSRKLRRRGVGTLLFMVFLAIFIMLLVLVVNYTYLAYSQLRTAEVTDTLARIAVTELLDEELLNNQPTDQAGDVDASEAIVAEYLDKMNDAAAANQQLRYTIGSNDPANTDIFVTAGRVDDLTVPVTDSGANPTFDATPPAADLLNTLRIEANRSKTGANPLYLFVRAAFTPQAADIGTTSFATLDSRLLGFRPTTVTPTPIVPIAISQNAWETGPRGPKGGIPGRLDFTGELKSAGTGNLVLLNFDQNDSVDVPEMTDQIEEGVLPDEIDVAGSDYLGPIAPGIASQLFNAEANTSAANGMALAQAFDNIAGERRIFPLYSTINSGKAEIVGFIGATVLDAAWNGGAGDLQLFLEPEFVVHFTAVTDRHFQSGMTTFDVPENVYVHKLRLSR